MADTQRLPGQLTDRTDWQLLGACRGLDTAVFFHPDGERGLPRKTREATAKALCRSCPVRAQCCQHALRVREPYGVWGGLSAADRDEILHPSRPAAEVTDTQPTRDH